MGADALPNWALIPGRLARRVAAAVSGNYDADTPAKHFARTATRALTFSTPFLIARISLLDGLISFGGVGMIVGAFQFAAHTVLCWTIVSVGVRSRDPARTALLHATNAAHPECASELSTFLRGCRQLLLLTAMEVLSVGRAVTWAMNPDVGVLWGLVALVVFNNALLGVIDVIFTAGQWVEASNCTVRGLGERVEAALVAPSGARDDGAPAAARSRRDVSRRPQTRRVSFFNTKEGAHGDAYSIDAAELGADSDPSAEGFSRELFQDAFEGTRHVVRTMNSILSGQ